MLPGRRYVSAADRLPAIHRLFVVCCVLFGGLLVPSTARATTYTVSKTADTNDGVCNADCSLREAVIAANTNPGADTITIPAGIYMLVAAGRNEDDAALGDLDIKGDVSISGAGAAKTIINARRIDRVFHLLSGTIVISGVTLRNGMVMSDDDNFPSPGYGGAIYSRSRVTVSINDTIIETSSAGAGGGIFAGSVAMTLTDVTIKNNTAGYGGGIALQLTTATLTNVLIWNNNAGGSGGIDVDRATLNATNTTISGNRVTHIGGGIRGFDITSRIVLNNSTITQNHANGNNSNPGNVGGGILASGSLILNNTIIAQNYQGPGTTTISNFGGRFEGDNNILRGDARLAPLADNGGPTLTHALQAGSPALDAGNNATCADTDQRGIVRPQPSGGVCDIGAFEQVVITPGALRVFLPLVFTTDANR